MLRLRHPSIVSLYATHESDPAALIMEYVPGQTLAALVAADGHLTPARACQIIEEIAGALDCVHAVGIVHRDVKPSNILLPPRGPAKLTDFGVARIDDDLPLTVMGDILGTIEYASPEQVHGNGAIDARSDVYSLAAVTYFCLTGTPPFRAADNSTQAQLSVMHRQVFAEPPPLRLHRSDLTPAMEEAVLRGLAKAPEARYASAGQLAAALRAAVVAASGEPQQGAMEASSRRTGALAGAAAAALLLLGGFVFWKADGLHHAGSARHTQVADATAPRLISTLVPKPVQAEPNKPIVSHSALPVAAAVSRIPKAPSKAADVKPSLKPTLIAQGPKPNAFKPAAVKKPQHATVAANRPKSLTSQFLLAQHSEAARKQGWLRVYAKQNIAGLGQPEKMAGIPAEKIIVDGKPAPALAAGQWVTLPAGRHWVSFYPWSKSGFGPRTSVPVTIGPGAHVGRQVLLAVSVHPMSKSPIATQKALVPTIITPAPQVGWYTVSGWAAIANQSPAQKAQLIRAEAQWIKVDGQPLLSLALGQWAALPAGRHLVTFQPIFGLGAGAKTWAIDVAPKAHLNQQVPLPAAPLPAIPPHLRNP